MKPINSLTSQQCAGDSEVSELSNVVAGAGSQAKVLEVRPAPGRSTAGSRHATAKPRKTKGIELLRRILGHSIGHNRHVSVSPAEAYDMLVELDRAVPRVIVRKPLYELVGVDVEGLRK